MMMTEGGNQSQGCNHLSHFETHTEKTRKRKGKTSMFFKPLGRVVKIVTILQIHQVPRYSPPSVSGIRRKDCACDRRIQPQSQEHLGPHHNLQRHQNWPRSMTLTENLGQNTKRFF